MAIVASYATLLLQVQQLKDTITELKQDRVQWVAQNDRVITELRNLSSSDAVQSARLDSLERAIAEFRRTGDRGGK